MTRILSVAVIGLLLAGCATLDKDECLNANWTSIGFEDGARGRQALYIGRHRKACAKHQVTPNMSEYKSGRKEGLLKYCVIRNGYKIGLAGRGHNSVCPSKKGKSFYSAFKYGKAIHSIQKKLNSNNHQLAEEERRREAIPNNIHLATEELIHKGSTPQRRIQLLKEIEQLKEDQHQNEDMIDSILHELEYLNAKMMKLMKNNPYKD